MFPEFFLYIQWVDNTKKFRFYKIQEVYPDFSYILLKIVWYVLYLKKKLIFF